MSLRRASLLACAWFVLSLCGCARPDKPAGPVGYFGPTLSFEEFVAGVNRNAGEIRTLWAKGDFEADIVDGGKKTFVNGEILLLFRKPGDFRLIGRKDVAGVIFEAGANSTEFWFLAKADVDAMWWGTWDRAPERPAGGLPVRPDLLREVLGIGPIGPDFTTPPVPVLRFNNDADAYMVVWSELQGDRWVARREVWYDRSTLLPRLVLLFDQDGRIVLRCYLSGHRPVLGADERAETVDAPRAAGEFRLFFPETGTRMNIRLSRVQSRSGNAPQDASFRFPGDSAGVSRVIRVDEAGGVNRK
jgi:hypothetical protein